MQFDTTHSQVLDEGLRDLVSASLVFGFASESGVDSDDDNRDLAIGAVAGLIVGGLMVAGDFKPGGYRRWECSPGEAVERIAREWWTTGNNDPIINEIFWLQITELGTAAAQARRLLGTQ